MINKYTVVIKRGGPTTSPTTSSWRTVRAIKSSQSADHRKALAMGFFGCLLRKVREKIILVLKLKQAPIEQNKHRRLGCMSTHLGLETLVTRAWQGTLRGISSCFLVVGTVNNTWSYRGPSKTRTRKNRSDRYQFYMSNHSYWQDVQKQ